MMRRLIWRAARRAATTFPESSFADWWRSRSVVREFRTRPPSTLNEKIRYRMAVDRRPLLTTIADKVAVRDYVATRVGRDVLTELYAVVDDPRDIIWSTLPARFVIKATHGSGATLIVDDRAPLSERLPVPDPEHPWGVLARIHPSQFDVARFAELAALWLRSNYWAYHGHVEWAYRDIPPRLMFEELLEDAAGGIPPDYKIWCFNGLPEMVQVDLDRMGGQRRSLHRPNWSLIDGTIAYPAPAVPPEPPRELDRLLSSATALAKDLDFVRVDFYVVEGRVVFGELTNYPGVGRSKMAPESAFAEIGSSWHPEDSRRPT